MNNPQPILSIDLKKNRIRIHKQTLHLLGDPEYIQLLVNPTARLIAVRRSIQGDYLAHRVRMCQLTARNSYELYSTNLLQTLCAVNEAWKQNELYRIYGELNSKEGVAQFSMDGVILVTDAVSDEV